MENREYKALILNDYPYAYYAQWVKEGKKKIETRMNKLFSFRGDVVICCGKTNSVSYNRGKAICIVEIYEGRDMKDTPKEKHAACIGYEPGRKALLLRNWRHFNRDFEFTSCKTKGSFQSMFDIKLPEDIQIIHKPEILPFVELV